MALFQPSNITPSAWAGEGQGVVTADSNISISWQVNGTSPLTSFKISIFPNTGNSEIDNSAIAYLYGNVDRELYPNGFYSTDLFGNPQFYTYEPGMTWADAGLSYGNNYKYKITQYSNDLSLEQNAFSSFSVVQQPVFSVITVVNSARISLIGEYEDTENPIESIRWIIKKKESGETIRDTGVVYTSQFEYIFDGAASGVTYSYSVELKFSNGYFMATDWEDIETEYSVTEEAQAQTIGVDGGVKINLSNNIVNIPGVGSNYKIDNETLYLNEPTSHVSWSNLGIENESGDITYNGKIYPAIVLSKENNIFAELPSWVTSGNGLLRISADGKYLIIICERKVRDTVYSSPYLYEKKGDEWVFLHEVLIGNESYKRASCCCFNPTDSSFFIVGSTDESEKLTIYKIIGDSSHFLQVQRPTRNDTQIGSVFSIDFAWNGNFFGICTSLENGGACMFSFENGTATYISDFLLQSSAFNISPHLIKFSPTRREAVISGYFSTQIKGCLYTYGPDGNPTWISYLNNDFGGEDSITDIAFSPDGNKLAFSGYRTNISPNTLFSYERSNGSWSYVGYLDTDNSIYAICFSPDSQMLVCAGGVNSSFRHTTISVFNTSSSTYTLSASMSSRTENNFIVNQYDSQRNAFLVLSSSGTYGGWYQVDLQDRIFILVKDQNGNTVLSLQRENGQAVLYTPQVQISGAMPDTEIMTIIYSNSSLLVTGFRPTPINRGNINIDSIDLYGGQECKYIFVGDSSDFILPKTNWQTGTKFLAVFNDPQLNAGTYNQYGTYANIVYVKKSDGEKNIAELPTVYESLIDYGEVSDEMFSYDIFLKTANGAYSVLQSSQDSLCQRLNAFYLFEATQDENIQSVYHVQKMWKFGNNTESGSISNNNAPNWLTNFTKYRLKQSTMRMGRTGTLSALISNAVNGVYNDTAGQMNALFAASQSQNTFFLKDPKGNLYMVAVSAPIQSQIRLGSTKLETTVSISWEEVGDAEKASLVAYPNDGGWQE